jgi:hypothetical protein
MNDLEDFSRDSARWICPDWSLYVIRKRRASLVKNGSH